MRILLALLAALALCSCAKTPDFVEIMPETPFFEKPDAKSKVVYVADSELKLACAGSVRAQVGMEGLVKGGWHPMELDTFFRKVELPKTGQAAWVSEDLRFDRNAGVLPLCSPKLTMFPLVALSFLLMLSSILLGLFARWEVFEPGWRSSSIALLFLISLRLCLLSSTVYLSGGLISCPVDEQSYFAVAKDILEGRFGEPDWLYTIGNALYYIPFILGLKATCYMDIRDAISLFNSCVVSCGSLALAWLLALKISGSRVKAFAATALWAVLPFIAFPVELHDIQAFKCVLALPQISPGSYRLYDIVNGTSVCGLSDAPSTFLALSCVALALALRPGLLLFASVSALFGVACLFRINNILLAPLLAFLFWRKLREWNEAGFLKTLAMAGISLGAFILTFSPQLAANMRQFGHPLTFPYILHGNGAARGFVISELNAGTNYLFGCNFIYVALAAAALPFVRGKMERTALALWAVPLLLFFAGYAMVGAAPIRFILTAYPAMFIALAAAGFWDELSGKGKTLLALALAAACALTSPCHRTTPPLPWNLEEFPWGPKLAILLEIAVPALCLVAALWLWRRSKAASGFLLLFCLLYFPGLPQLPLLAFTGALAWTIVGWGHDVLSKLKAGRQA